MSCVPANEACLLPRMPLPFARRNRVICQEIGFISYVYGTKRSAVQNGSGIDDASDGDITSVCQGLGRSEFECADMCQDITGSFLRLGFWQTVYNLDSTLHFEMKYQQPTTHSQPGPSPAHNLPTMRALINSAQRRDDRSKPLRYWKVTHSHESRGPVTRLLQIYCHELGRKDLASAV